MSFRIQGLDPDRFAALFDRTDAELAAQGILRRIADEDPGYPCRVSLAYAPVGAELLLLPFEHQPARSPYRASGPIYVRRDVKRFDAVDTLPDCVARARLLSLRAYDRADLIAESAVVKPADVRERIEALLANPDVAYLHVHNAAPGCFSCRVDRA